MKKTLIKGLVAAAAVAAAYFTWNYDVYAAETPYELPVERLAIGCTAFPIQQHIWITAGHCIEHTDNVYIQLDGTTPMKVEVIAFNSPFLSNEDYAILDVPNLYSPYTLDLACDEPNLKAGDKIRLTGFPAFYGKTTVQGYVAGDGGVNEVSFYANSVRIVAPVFGGHSGSPVVSEESGKVVGILTLGHPGNPSLAAYEPIQNVCDELHRKPILED